MTAGHVVIAGGSGFLGASLARALLASGRQPVVLTRSPRTRTDGVIETAWDGTTPGAWCDRLEGAAAVVNLTGRSVDCRHNDENRREIIASRVDSVRVLGDALARCRVPPPVWVQAGSTAIYGDAGDRPCAEDAPHGGGFPAEVCEAWEAAFARHRPAATRGVILRISFVLGRDGGALAVLARLARCFLGGAAGSGRQFISWLHLADMDAVFLRAIADPAMTGIYNACSDDPVTNRAFMRELRRAVARPWAPPTPAWAVRIGARLMGTEADLALTGRRCVPRRLLDAGYSFRFPTLAPALAELLAATPRPADGARR